MATKSPKSKGTGCFNCFGGGSGKKHMNREDYEDLEEQDKNGFHADASKPSYDREQRGSTMSSVPMEEGRNSGLSGSAFQSPMSSSSKPGEFTETTTTTTTITETVENLPDVLKGPKAGSFAASIIEIKETQPGVFGRHFDTPSPAPRSESSHRSLPIREPESSPALPSIHENAYENPMMNELKSKVAERRFVYYGEDPEDYQDLPANFQPALPIQVLEPHESAATIGSTFDSLQSIPRSTFEANNGSQFPMSSSPSAPLSSKNSGRRGSSSSNKLALVKVPEGQPSLPRPPQQPQPDYSTPIQNTEEYEVI
jgi:hypothetical protein